MRILITCDRYPGRPYDGLTLRIDNYVRQLSARHQFDLVCVADEHTPANVDLERHLGTVRRIPCKPAPPRQQGLFARLRSGFDIHQLYIQSDNIAAAIGQQCAAHRYDLIWDAGCNMLLNLVEARRTIPLLADQVDDAVLALGRHLSRSIKPYERLWLRKQIMLQKRFARTYIADAGRVLFVSPFDEASFQAFCPRARTATIANGVDSDYFTPRPQGPATDAPLTLVFEGVMSFEPNVEAVQHLLADVMPLVWQQEPSARLSIVGRDPAPSVLALRQERVEVTGFVDDIRPHLPQNRIFVCPMRMGAGIKNKILQAWAMGMAVVSTPEGAQGLPATDGDNLLLRSGPQAFAQAVLALGRDAALRARLGAAGRRVVEGKFSWAAKAQAFEQLCSEVAHAR